MMEKKKKEKFSSGPEIHTKTESDVNPNPVEKNKEIKSKPEQISSSEPTTERQPTTPQKPDKGNDFPPQRLPSDVIALSMGGINTVVSKQP